MTITIRPYNHDTDHDQPIADLHQKIRAWQLEVGQVEVFGDDSRPDLTDIQGRYINRRGGFWLAIEDHTNRVVGFVALRRDAILTAAIKRFAVDPEYHNQGIGSRLIAALMAGAETLGVRELNLATGDREQARGIYERNGFKVVGWDPGPRDYLMHMEFPPAEWAAATSAPEPVLLGKFSTLEAARAAFGEQTWHPTLEGYVNAPGTIALTPTNAHVPLAPVHA